MRSTESRFWLIFVGFPPQKLSILSVRRWSDGLVNMELSMSGWVKSLADIAEADTKLT